MSKAIWILDETPDNCQECKLVGQCFSKSFGNLSKDFRPYWCPLVDMEQAVSWEELYPIMMELNHAVYNKDGIQFNSETTAQLAEAVSLVLDIMRGVKYE